MSKTEIYNSPLIEKLLKGITPEELEKTEKRMLLASSIDEAIKAKGWKKKDFAKALGKTPSEITKWLSGTHNFTSDTLFDIERVLGISIIKLDTKLKEITQKYYYKVSFQAKQESSSYGSSMIYNKSSKPTYKAKSHLNTISYN